MSLLVLTLCAFTGCSSERLADAPAPADWPADGPISIALTGDTSFTTLAGVSSSAIEIVRSATVAFTNLEVNLLDQAGAETAAARQPPRWIFARAAESRPLRALGFDAVSLANNHAMDYGATGLTSTVRALDDAGIAHAGAGADLAAARAEAIIGRGPRRVALVAVTASASDQTRASASQPDIQGRPGVSPLLYDAAITVDAATYRTLAQSVTALQAGPPPGEREMTMFGRRIAKGEQTRVEFTLSRSDAQGVLAAVRAARQRAEVVIVSVHSHEPTNDSDEPADFLRQFAHDAVDAGAQLIVGHGPHRVRGVEIYKRAAIFYSLGNFLYQTDGLDFRAADQFDAGSNLYTAALGTSADAPSPFSQLDRDSWWEGALVVATAVAGTISQVRVYPVTLKGPDQLARNGLPQLAAGVEADTILRRFSALSKQLGTTVEGISRPFLELPIPENR